MSVDQWIMLAAGCVSLLGGVAAILLRDTFANWNRKNIESRFGASGVGARRTTPGMMIWLGLGWSAIGVGLLLASLAHR